MKAMSTDRLYQLAAKADEQLRQFRFDATDPQAQAEEMVKSGRFKIAAYRKPKKEDEGVSVPRMIGRGVVGAGLVAGGMQAYQDRDKIKAKAGAAVNKAKAGFGQARTAVTEAGKDVAWKATRKTAEGLNSTGNLVGRLGKKVAGKSATVDNAVGGLKGALKKGAKTLKKGSMKFWDRGTCDRIVDLAARIEGLRVL